MLNVAYTIVQKQVFCVYKNINYPGCFYRQKEVQSLLLQPVLQMGLSNVDKMKRE